MDRIKTGPLREKNNVLRCLISACSGECESWWMTVTVQKSKPRRTTKTRKEDQGEKGREQKKEKLTNKNQTEEKAITRLRNDSVEVYVEVRKGKTLRTQIKSAIENNKRVSANDTTAEWPTSTYQKKTACKTIKSAGSHEVPGAGCAGSPLEKRKPPSLGRGAGGRHPGNSKTFRPTHANRRENGGAFSARGCARKVPSGKTP